MNHLSLWDFILAPIYLIIVLAIAKHQQNKRYPVGHSLRQYYMQGLYVKLGGAIFITFIYAFYYGGGDTFQFYYHSEIINSSLSDSVSTWFKLITRQSVEKNPEIYSYASRMMWYEDPSSYTVASVGAIIGLFCGTNYLPAALIFAFLSFTGIWAMYRTFVNMYPKLHKELAVAFLFIPSTFVWGSAVFKDTLCMFGLGWMIYTTFRIFVNRDFTMKNLSMLFLSFYLIASVKVYILMAFLPALSLWLLMTYSKKIPSVGLRWLVNLFFIAVTIAGFFYFSEKFASELGKYSLDNVAQTAATTRGWIAYASGDEGSAYDLGEFDPSITGMLSKFPISVATTLFRPFPWEAKKVIQLLSALESLIFFYFTLKILFGFKKYSIKPAFKDPNVIFFLVFSLIFAFAVGISSYNFGALSRYKIPCLPFYAAFLVILLHQKGKEEKNGAAQLKRARKVPAWA